MGINGSILHTEDGGGSWKDQRSDTNSTLASVVFPEAHSGWVVGTDGVILHTENGGRNWSRFSGERYGISVVFRRLLLHSN